jgi:hypothetical protein
MKSFILIVVELLTILHLNSIIFHPFIKRLAKIDERSLSVDQDDQK